MNPLGIEVDNGVFKALPERAICDKIYLDGPEFFDNLRSIDKSKIIKINSQVFNDNKIIKKWISQNTK